MTRLFLLAALAAGGLAMPALAQRVSPVTGAKLLQICSGDAGSSTACEAYISGISDVIAYQEAEGRQHDPDARLAVCIPGRTTGAQLRQVVSAWLRRNPGEAGKQAAPLVVTALRSAFPCSKAPV